MLNDIVKNLLNEVSGMMNIPSTGAFNIRNNGQSEGRKSTENIDIVPKPNGEGMDIYVKTKKKTITQSSTFTEIILQKKPLTL